MGLIRFIFWLLLFYLVFKLFFRYIFPLILKSYIKRFQKKFYEQNASDNYHEEEKVKIKDNITGDKKMIISVNTWILKK